MVAWDRTAAFGTFINQEIEFVLSTVYYPDCGASSSVHTIPILHHLSSPFPSNALALLDSWLLLNHLIKATIYHTMRISQSIRL